MAGWNRHRPRAQHRYGQPSTVPILCPDQHAGPDLGRFAAAFRRLHHGAAGQADRARRWPAGGAGGDTDPARLVDGPLDRHGADVIAQVGPVDEDSLESVVAALREQRHRIQHLPVLVDGQGLRLGQRAVLDSVAVKDGRIGRLVLLNRGQTEQGLRFFVASGDRVAVGIAVERHAHLIHQPVLELCLAERRHGGRDAGRQRPPAADQDEQGSGEPGLHN